MEYSNRLKDYAAAPTVEQVAEEVAALRKASEENYNTDVYKFCYSSIDLTTLSCNDSVESVTAFARRCAEFYIDYPHIPNVASICVYPPFVETVGLAIDGTPMRITSVAGGFPSSQTFLEVKTLEVAMAIENGADEIDIVINVGKVMTGAYDEAAVLAAKKAKQEPLACGCPGSACQSIQSSAPAETASVPSRLRNFPVQIKLAPVNAPYFDGAHLLIAADCTAYAYGNFHRDFMQDKVTLIGCPKLDGVSYAEKLSQIFANNDIRSITITRMTVP